MNMNDFPSIGHYGAPQLANLIGRPSRPWASAPRRPFASADDAHGGYFEANYSIPSHGPEAFIPLVGRDLQVAT